MNDWTLPLVEYLITQQDNLDLKNVRIIGVQHILETTHSMFRSFYKRGLKPENVSLIGKCYSTNLEVLEEMQADGIDASERSLAYDSHISFDDAFNHDLRKFIEDRREEFQNKNYDLLIILDDGGKLLGVLKEKQIETNSPIVGIEQTSAGYELIKNRKMIFPVLNVAKEPLKLNLESPMIAQACFDRLFPSIRKVSKGVGNFLIIGGGPIGQSIFNTLSAKHYKADIFDLNEELSSFNSLILEKLIEQYDCIIGCTGQTSIPFSLHSHLKKGTILVSVSSSDREFDAVYLRRQIKVNHNCHQNLKIEDVHLINSGFPVNFDGERENIELDQIQLTIALIAAAIIQACQENRHLTSGIFPLSSRLTDPLAEEFKRNYSRNI